MDQKSEWGVTRAQTKHFGGCIGPARVARHLAVLEQPFLRCNIIMRGIVSVMNNTGLKVPNDPENASVLAASEYNIHKVEFMQHPKLKRPPLSPRDVS